MESDSPQEVVVCGIMEDAANHVILPYHPKLCHNCKPDCEQAHTDGNGQRHKRLDNRVGFDPAKSGTQ